MKPGKRIFLTGMMGSGKSTVGPLLAGALGWRFVDLDERVAAKAGLPVAEIFRKLGEARFRSLEAGLLKSCSRRSSVVVATGGGAVLLEDNRRWMEERGLKVYLKAPPEALWPRLKKGGVQSRPLLAGGGLDRYRAIYRQRKELFEEASVVVAATGSPAKVRDRILGIWGRALKGLDTHGGG